jgi:hypothetical protein
MTRESGKRPAGQSRSRRDLPGAVGREQDDPIESGWFVSAGESRQGERARL